MADEAKGGGGSPRAIERSKIIILPALQKAVEVRRWSIARLMTVSRLINGIIGDLPEGIDIDMKGALQVFFENGGESILEVARLSVAPEYRALLDDEADGADVLAILDEAFRLNDNGEGIKKVSLLGGRFVLGKVKASLQQMAEETTAKAAGKS